VLVHGSNLTQKEHHRTKYRDETSRSYLREIQIKYDEWHVANIRLVGPSASPDPGDKSSVAERVRLLEGYKEFIDQQKYAEQFDSRSNLHSTVLEEFLYYLFRDLASDFGRVLVGRSRAFKDMFFVPPDFGAMTRRPFASIERKDHDFVIGTTVQADLCVIANEPEFADAAESETSAVPAARDRPVEPERHFFDVAAVVIECKTYLDKTMLEGASRAAEELKARNPNGLYIVIMEWLKLSSAVNLRKYKVDQIYVLRKQKNTDREFRFAPEYAKNPIDVDVVWHLYSAVRTHLTSDWEGGVEHGIERGWLI